eukprot:3906152-Rhodomonas_salina.1
MTISCSIPEPVWDSNFTLLNILEPQLKHLLRDTIIYAIQRLYEFLGVRKAPGSIPAGLSATLEGNG